VTYKGLAKGKVIELQEPLPYPEGQPINVSVEPAPNDLPSNSPQRIRQAMDEPPHLEPEDVDALEQLIQDGKLPVHQENPFDIRH